MIRRGAYITYDGPEACGKSTQIARLTDASQAVITREPGGYIDHIRHLLLHEPDIELTPEAEALLFSSDRNLTLEHIIKPSIAEGRPVIGDRSYLSTVAYQGYGHGLDLGYIYRATKLAIGGFRADRQIIIDVPYEESVRRMHAAGKDTQADRYERLGEEFHNRVRNGFYQIASELGERALLIDGTGSIDEIYEEIYHQTGELLINGVEVPTEE